MQKNNLKKHAYLSKYDFTFELRFYEDKKAELYDLWYNYTIPFSYNMPISSIHEMLECVNIPCILEPLFLNSTWDEFYKALSAISYFAKKNNIKSDIFFITTPEKKPNPIKNLSLLSHDLKLQPLLDTIYNLFPPNGCNLLYKNNLIAQLYTTPYFIVEHTSIHSEFPTARERMYVEMWIKKMLKEHGISDQFIKELFINIYK